METLMQASNQWASRPADERFTSLIALNDHCIAARRMSAQRTIATRDIEVRPVEGNHKGLVVVGPSGNPAALTHWSFGQLAQRAGAPTAYVRDLPAPLAADCLNYGLKVSRDVAEIGILLQGGSDNGPATLRAATGPSYGRVWNSTITKALVDRFGDGLTGDFRVPGEFGKEIVVDKANTTLYASDRDMFVFLADEKHRIEVPNRRNGEAGSLARGFFIWNSEVGAQTFGVATFLFDYVCCNRIVWGATGYKELRIRHTAGAPHRWVEEVAPALEAYAQSSAVSVTEAIAKARTAKLGGSTTAETSAAVEKFLRDRFTRGQAQAIQLAHVADEERPIETLWDIVTGVTAYARGVSHQDERVGLEREAGKILDLAA